MKINWEWKSWEKKRKKLRSAEVNVIWRTTKPNNSEITILPQIDMKVFLWDIPYLTHLLNHGSLNERQSAWFWGSACLSRWCAISVWPCFNPQHSGATALQWLELLNHESWITFQYAESFSEPFHSTSSMNCPKKKANMCARENCLVLFTSIQTRTTLNDDVIVLPL